MSKAGWHCTVLEAAGRPGGRNLTARGGDMLTEGEMRQEVCFDREDHLYANLGPARIPYYHRTVLGYHRPKGVPVGAYIWSREPGLRYSAMPAPERRLRAALEEGEPLHPGYAGEVECGVSRAWLNVPFQKGGWPRRNEEAAAVLRPGDGPLRFAGNQVTALPGWQEGALLAAHAAAKAIHDRHSNK